MARTMSFDRQDAVAGARALFWRRGYDSASTGDLEAATGVAVGVDIYAAKHCTAYNLLRCRITDTGGMVIYEVFLEVLDLVIIEHHLREFANTGVYTVHDFMSIDFLLEHGTAFEDPPACVRVKLHFLSVTCNIYNVIYG